MPLDFETVPIAFTHGLDTRTHRKLVVPGKWDDLMNFSLSADGTPATRDGHSALVGSANGNGLALYGNELLAINGGAVSSVSTGASTANLRAGRRGYVNVTKSEVRRSTGMQETPDCATSGTFSCFVWREKSSINAVTGVSMMLVDEATGTQLIPATFMRVTATVLSPRVAFRGGLFFILYLDGGAMFARIIDAATPTVLGAETNLGLAAIAIGPNFDVIPWFAASPFVLVGYGSSDVTTSIRVVTVGRAAGLPAVALGPTNVFTQAALPIANLTAIALASFSPTALAAIFTTATGAGARVGLSGATLNSALTVIDNNQLSATVGATTSACHLTAAVASTGGSPLLRVFRDYVSERGTSALNNIQSVDVTTLMTVQTGPTNIAPSATFSGAVVLGPNGPFIAGKAFNEGSRVLLPVHVESTYNDASATARNPRTANTQNVFFVLDTGNPDTDLTAASPSPVVAKALYRSYGLASISGSAPVISTPCSTFVGTAGTWSMLCGELTQLVIADGITVSPVGLVRLNLTPVTASPPSSVQLGESTYFAGGSLTAYNGVGLTEHGFPLFPEGIGLVAGGAGTGNMTDGVHQVVAVYEWVDETGQRHLSAPSLPVSVTTATGGANTGSITVTVPTLLVSQKAGVMLLVFVTTAGGLTFYRPFGSGTSAMGRPNDTTVNSLTLLIQQSDAVLSGNEILYTQPNIAPTTLANVAPGPCTALCIAHNRLFFDRSDQPFQFGYSQPYVNNLGLQFHPDLFASVPADSGGILALAGMDEKVVIFCRRRIYVMFGQGPDSAGNFNNYSAPQDIQSDVGCLDARSVLSEFPGGIIFKARSGFHILGRDLSVKYIGEAVARFDANTVTAAVLLEDRKEARFVTTGTAGALNGVTLVYSYLTDQWSYFSQTLGAGYLPLGAVWWPGGGTAGFYVTISAANGLNRDVAGQIFDAPGVQAAVGITTRARTGWLHLAALQGFQRARRLYFSGTTLTSVPNSTLAIAVDYDDAYGAVAPGAYSISVALGAAMSINGASIDLRHKLQRQKCKSVAFTFTETAGVASVRMTGIQALALEVGRKRGLNRLPAAQGV